MDSEDASDGNEGSEIENTDVKSELNTAIRKLNARHHCSISPCVKFRNFAGISENTFQSFNIFGYILSFLLVRRSGPS